MQSDDLDQNMQGKQLHPDDVEAEEQLPPDESATALQPPKPREKPTDKDTEKPKSEEEHTEPVELIRQAGGFEINTASDDDQDNTPPRQLLLIGLAGAVPDLLLRIWRPMLPTINRLLERSYWSLLQSSLPHTSIPAWPVLLTGQDPGQLGLYGWQQRVNRHYTSFDIYAPYLGSDVYLWELLARAGKQVGAIGPSLLLPNDPSYRKLITAPRLEPIAVFPKTLQHQISIWQDELALFPARPPDNQIEQLIQTAYTQTEQRFMLARRLLARNTYDCFVLLDDSIARLQQVLWDSLDPTHPHYSAEHPFEGTIGSFYRFIDEQIGELLDLVDENTIVALVSAHGAEALQGEFALNEWLLSTGHLVLESKPVGVVNLAACTVDWPQTHAWADHNGALYLNIAGREPSGSIPSNQREAVLIQLTEQLRSLTDPLGRPAVSVHRPEFLYRASQGVVPDLLIVCQQQGWRPTTTIGWDTPWIDASINQMDASHETPTGFLVLHAYPGATSEQQLEQATIYDVLPTLLTLLKQTHSASTRGKALIDLE